MNIAPCKFWARLSPSQILLSCCLLSSAAAATKPEDITSLDLASLMNMDVRIVTVQMRAEDIQRIPASVSVLSGNALETDHIGDYEDLSRVLPGLSFLSGGGPGLDNIVIRGISSTSGSATVGIYLDDISLTVKNLYNGAIAPKFFDMDRLELLRGPQGTLYGSSSMGGTIKLTSRQPNLQQMEGYVGADQSFTERGGYNYEANGVLNLPLIADVFALRFGAAYADNEGYIDHLARDGGVLRRRVNDDRTAVVRLTALYKPSDTLTLTPALFLQRRNIDDLSVFDADLGRYRHQKRVLEPGRDDLTVGSLTVDKDFSRARLTSISSYFEQYFERIGDGTDYNSGYFGFLIDADPVLGAAQAGSRFAALPGPVFPRTRTTQLAQEFRLASNSTDTRGHLRNWIVGLYYSNQKILRRDQSFITGFNDIFANTFGVPPAATALFSGESFPNDSIGEFRFDVDEERIAAFAQMSIELRPRLNATAGLRYDQSQGRFSEASQGFFSVGSGVFSNEASFNSVTPRMVLSYDLGQSVMTYASASRGYRNGGGENFVPEALCAGDLQALGLSSAPTRYDSDRLWSFELGEKARVSDDRLSINGSLYYIKWDSIQQNVPLPVCGFVVTTNIGNAASYGTELEIRAQPTPQWTLFMNGGLTHAALTRVATPSGTSSGDHLLNVPAWTLTTGIEYSRPFIRGSKLRLRADYDWTGPSQGTVNPLDTDYRRPSYSIANLNLNIDLSGLRFTLYAKNALNQSTVVQSPSLLFVSEDYVVRPRTLGLAIIKHFRN